jgi:site-specific recombinase XerD
VTTLRQRMLEDLQIRNYAPNTIAAYLRGVAGFAKHFGKPPDQLGPEHIRQYQLFLSQQKRASLSTYIQVVAGLRFFYTHTLHRQVAIERMPLPRYQKKLPIILSQQEVKALLEAPRNLGHRAMLSTLYATGLRVSELVHLKVHDIEPATRSGFARAKGARIGKPYCRRSCWGYSASTGGGNSPQTGCFPATSPVNPSAPRPSSGCARRPEEPRALAKRSTPTP